MTILVSRPSFIQPVLTFMQELWHSLPQGHSLESEEWSRYHWGIICLLYVHAAGVPAFGLFMNHHIELSFIGGMVLAGFAALAMCRRFNHRIRAALATVGLIISSSLIVHISGGYIESHFHFFVMMAVIVLYQDWVPFLLGLISVVVDHGLIGTLAPMMVYNHPAAQHHPWAWALIHGGFVLAECVSLLFYWHVNEAAQQKLKASKHQAEELVKQKRALLATVEAFFIQLTDGAVVAEWTKQAERAFGIPASEAIGQPFRELAITWDWAAVQEAITQVTQSREAVHLNKLSVMRPGERARFLKLALSPLPKEDGLDLVLMGEDITEYLALEHDLSQAQKLESLGQLAAGVAHEINTPTQFVGDNMRFLSDAFTDLQAVLERHAALLTAAKAGQNTSDAITQCETEAQRADLAYLADEVPKAIAQSLDGVERIAKIVRAMKEFAHPGGDEAAYEDLNKAIETTVEVSRNEWKYVAEVTTDLAPDLPLVCCQLGPINQVVLNIIVNAAHAIGDLVKGTTQKGRIAITTRAIGEGVEMQIADTGGGIPETIREKIFDPFFTTKPVGKGTGQGLAIARSVVDKHGGTITLDSQMGQGTTFRIWLPLKPAEAPPLPKAA